MSTLKTSLLTTRIVSLLVASMAVISASGSGDAPRQGLAPRPSLVVGIVVEGLDGDYVRLLRDRFGNDGFNRLISDGVTFENIDFGPGLDPQAAAALLMTGASAGVNGIPSATVYDPTSRTEKPVLGTSTSYTPAQLLVSTLSDEIRIADDGLNQVHSIAADPQMAVILAGHAANSAYWIDDVNGKWVSSPYYREVPTVISRRNNVAPLSLRIDTMAWVPSMDLTLYPDLPEHKKIYPFRHTFSKREPDAYKSFKVSATGNREIADAATEYISELGLGTRGVTDMLNISLTLSPYRYVRQADNRIETMDAYLRLDSDLARIFKAIEKTAGMRNTLVFIAGTPAPASRKRDDEKWGIPTGRFSPRRAVSLLNMYLIAMHGNGEYVSGYHNGYFYLNNKYLRDRDLDPVEIRKKSAEFLMRMSGVSRVFTIDDIIARDAGDNPVALRRNTSLAHAGDLLIAVNPGWVITDIEDDEAVPTSETAVSFTSTLAPAWILSPDLTPRVIGETVDARILAPTVSRLLRIRSPNATSVPPMRIEQQLPSQ